MDFLKPVIDFDRFVRGLLFLAVITVLVLGLRWLSPVLIPFFAAVYSGKNMGELEDRLSTRNAEYLAFLKDFSTLQQMLMRP